VGCTVSKLLGGDGTLTVDELYGWAAYYKKKNELERQAIEEAKRGG
jgi:hypothetical protein